MEFWTKLSITKKFNLLTILIILFFTVIIGFAINYKLNSLMKEQLALSETQLKNKHQEVLENQIASVISILEMNYKKGSENGNMDEAKIVAMNAVQNYRYKNKGYIWIQDYKPNMIMHPLKPSLNGKFIGEVKDPNKVKLFVEMAKVCKDKGEGYVNYMWAKPGFEKPQPKLSFVKDFKQWGWIVGTGVYIDDIAKEVTAQKEILQMKYNQLKLWLFIAIFIFSITLIFTINYLLKKIILEGIKEFSDIISKLATGSGDLTIRSHINRQDEIGFLSNNINKFLDTQQKMIQEITTVTENVAAMGTELSTSTEEINSTTNEISNGVMQTSNAMESTSATITQMAANLQSLDTNINSLTNYFEEILSSTHEGTQAVMSSIERMADIKESAEQIETIVTVISDIAKQTNLLSLNAAIEAAKAGEQGKGFAVVAEEVRKLAERSGEAGKEITNLITISSQKVEEGSKIISTAGEILNAILDNVKNTSDLVQEIQNSSQEQSKAVEDVVQATDNVTEHSMQNATGVEEMSNTIEEISKTVMELAELGENLKAMVEKFTI